MSSDTSRTAAATGKAYRALKDLVRATLKPPYRPLEPRVTWSGRATRSRPTPRHSVLRRKAFAFAVPSCVRRLGLSLSLTLTLT